MKKIFNPESIAVAKAFQLPPMRGKRASGRRGKAPGDIEMFVDTVVRIVVF